jgi:hypothetical protein
MNNLYKRQREHSLNWFNKASDLRAAAAAVYTSMDDDVAKIVKQRADLGDGFSMPVAVRAVFEMLCGMSLELIFKAITVERGFSVNERVHDLLDHLKTTGLSYNEKERELLKLFSHAVTWEGRYPAPKREDAMEEYQELVQTNLFQRVPTSPGSDLTALRWNDAMNWQSYSALWSKAHERYFGLKDAEPPLSPAAQQEDLPLDRK